MHWEERFSEKARTQYGLVARFQLPTLGCTIDDWWHARRSGRWPAMSARVLAAGGAPASDEQRVLAAVLDASPGAVLHGRSTLAWLGVGTYDLRELHVARPRGITRMVPNLARLHDLRCVRAHDVFVARGVVTETALRAIWSEAGRYARPDLLDVGAAKIGRLLDIANRRKLVTWHALAESVDGLQRRGRAGTVLMRALAEARPPGSSPTDSRQEDRFEDVLSNAGERGLRRQPHLGGHEPIGRCDFRDDELPLAVEVNSELYHTNPTDREADVIRYAALNDAGFTVGVGWERDLWSRPPAVLTMIRAARRAAAEGLPIVLHSAGCPWPDPLPPTHRRL